MKIFKDITFSSPPVLLAAWPGMGNVGLIAMDYLRRKLHASSFAEIDMSPFFFPDSIIVKDGIAQFPEVPSSIFTYHENPNLIIFESNVQLGGHDGISIIKTILDIIQQFNVNRIFTAAAFAQSMSYENQSKVLMASNTIKLVDLLAAYNVTPMPDGYIAGQNGLMLGVANTRGIDSACLLGTIPSYATNLTYPKASLEIIKIFVEMFNLQLDLSEIEASAAEMNAQLATIEDRIRQFFPNNHEEDEEIQGIDEEKVPQFIMDRIEKLFNVVAQDRSKAPELKRELDRWNLYELYENRFLDLFDDDKRKDR